MEFQVENFYLNKNLYFEINSLYNSNNSLNNILIKLIDNNKDRFYLEEIGLFILNYNKNNFYLLGIKKIERIGKYRFLLDNIKKVDFYDKHILTYKAVEYNKTNYRIIKKIEDKIFNRNNEYFLEIFFYDNWGDLNNEFLDMIVY